MLLHLCLGISTPAPLRWRASTPGAPRRAILPPRMGAENRMASHGLLYEGWGKEGMENLNTSCSVLDKGYEHEMNRYEITLMVARRAKEAAYQQTQDEDESQSQAFRFVDCHRFSRRRSDRRSDRRSRRRRSEANADTADVALFGFMG